MSKLGSLVEELERGSGAAPLAAPVISRQVDNQLTQVRLGIANSLYTSLRIKHPATASHSLRVALSSSAWSLAAGIADETRDGIEVAALLHDVGMIGVPDRILLKPGPLDRDETRIVDRARAMSLEILRCACALPDVLDIVRNLASWYDGSRAGYALSGKRLPLGGRMIAIVEAFDAMTNDHVFRPAMSRETALGELFAFAGTQFDPDMVRQFAELDCCDQSALRREVASRWLHTVDPEAANSFWGLTPPVLEPRSVEAGQLFQVRLLDNMHDAVVFVDAEMRVIQWNHGAERLTGIAGSSVHKRQWVTDLLGIRNERGALIGEDDCPVVGAINSGVQSLRRLSISGRNGRTVAVDSHTIPVVADDGTVLGAILLLHDASPEASLEQRCQSLHEKATRDPLTQVANRAEFDRVHAAFVNQHRDRQVPCSLIICDLDRFKQVNDNYGHQAGDDAIKSLATLLKNSSRPGDLVARYGGEEFVILCADCDNATATRRAEQLRVTLGQTPQPKMDGRSITASFGVTQIQPGDTAETMLRRADRALLMAKEKGRNAVVQLGSGTGVEEESKRRGGAARPRRADLTVEQELVSSVPVKMAIEKLRGFVSDHQAKVVSTEGSQVSIEINDGAAGLRRRSDRPMTFALDLQFCEEHVEQSRSAGLGPNRLVRTRIRVKITPRRKRDRRRADLAIRAREVLASIRSYLMASEVSPATTKDTSGKAGFLRIPWLSRR